MNLKNLFKFTQPVQTAVAPTVNNPDNIRDNETYVAYGRRMCGRVNASIHVLNPLMQRVFLHERQRQSDDERLQQSHRQRLREEIVELNRSIDSNQIEQDHAEQKKRDKEDQIVALRNELDEAKGNIGEANKMARVKMTIGLLILAILTVYLFIFYSSTFFSAFFKDFDEIGDNLLAQAMFDSKALPMALANGLGCLMFVCTAPIIFMGLGYLLHFYSVEKGNAKYLKIGVTVAITFIFDCILAYLIAKKIYDIDIMTRLGEFPPFSISMAITDINVWAVIYCGFITYMIWGFVFDLTMSAYEELKTNKKEISRIENEIKHNEEAKREIIAELTRLRTQKVEFESKKTNLENRLNQNTYIWDDNVIRTAISDFFAGWIAMMDPLGRTNNEQLECQEVYNQTINQLFNNN